MKSLITIAALLSLVVPAALAAPPAGQGPQAQGQSSASGTCKEQRKAVGMTAFRLQYAPAGSPKAAMDACLAQQVQLVSTAAKNAAKECKAERGTSPQSIAAFNDTYGTNGNKRNAFGKCVSAKAGAALVALHEATLNAAQKCKALRGTTPHSIAAFNDTYGTNANKRNAFGKCVSKLAQAQT
jgi:hypothetical protein